MTPTSRYVHGTHPEEQRRLADLNTLVNHASLEALAAEPGERALDVGSGLGQFARALARVTGERVVAVGRGPEQTARAGAGLEPRHINLLPFGACAGEASFPAYVANLGAVFDGAREAILATGGVSAMVFDDAQAALRAWGQRRDAAFWYSISWAEAVKP